MTTPQQEAAQERKAEKMLAGHRQAPDGRNIFAFRMRSLDNGGYRDRFDDTFSLAPGSEDDLSSRYCSQCDKLRSWCTCK